MPSRSLAAPTLPAQGGFTWFEIFRTSSLALLLSAEVAMFAPALHSRVPSSAAVLAMPRALRQDELIDLIVAVLAATALFGWRRFRDEVGADGCESIRRACAWKQWLGFHFLAILAIAFWTGAGTPTGASASALEGLPAGAWLLGWAALASTIVWTWAGAVTSRPMRRTSAALIGGGIVLIVALRAGMHAQSLWHALQEPTLWMVFTLLRIAGSDPVVDPIAAVVGTRRFSVTVYEGCAGLEGIGLISVLVVSLLWLDRDEYRFPQALLLWPLGMVAIWLLDVVRITLLIRLGEWRGELAVAGFHSFAGWVAVSAVAFSLAIAGRRLRFFRRPTCIPAPIFRANPAAPYLLPLLAITATTLVTQGADDGLDTLYPARVIIGGGALWWFRRQIGSLEWAVSAEAVFIGVVVAALWIASLPREGAILLEARGARLGDDLARFSPGGGECWSLVRILGAVFVVPLAEELAFRGYLLRKLVSRDFEKVPMRRVSWFALAATSIAFGALHQRWLAGTAAGLLFAAALYRRGRLCDAIVAHGTSNAVIAGFALATARWPILS